MSKIDDFELETQSCKNLLEDVKILARLRVEDIMFTGEGPDVVDPGNRRPWKSWSSDEPKELLIEAMNRPETRKLMEDIVEARRMRAKNAAIEECQNFLKKYVISPIMED
jgi:hypothetical protein